MSNASDDLPEPGQTGEDDQRVARQVKVDAAQVVLARTLDDQAVSQLSPFPGPNPQNAVRAHAMCHLPTSPSSERAIT